jgi:hypothetical protein
MADVAEQQALLRAANNDADVAAKADRPEVLILRPVELVELYSGVGRVHLEVKGRTLRGFLFFALSLARLSVQ